MDANLKLKVGLDSLKKAKLYTKNCNYGRAFAHYLVFLELVEKQRKRHEKQFTKIMFIWGKLLEERNQMENLCKCYLQALNYFPLSVKILSNFGTHLIRINEYEEARKYLQLAHNLAPDFLPTERNLTTIKGELVERWHFPMLNDYERNMAYYKAILAYTAITNAKVVDIGTGCGLLSLFASNNESIVSIHAIESSITVSSIASDVFIGNNNTKIRLHRNHSTELNYVNIDGRADLLITEIFDTGLFGEQALKTLIHAWENLLNKDAKVIPASANLYVTGIECFDILKNYKLINKNLKLENICLIANTQEPYNSKNLKLLQYKVLTESKNVLKVDFANITQLKDLQEKKDYFDLQSLKIISSGRLDAFAVWFNLYLDDNIMITTDPIKENVKCWEQAIISVNHPPICNINDDIQIKLRCFDGKLSISLANKQVTCTQCFKVSPEIVTFLNDDLLISTLEKTYDISFCNKSILDTFPFPVLGLKYAKNNKCYCIVKSEEDKAFIEYVCNLNNISKENVCILEERKLNYVIMSKICKFDAIFLDLVCKNGTVNEHFLSNFKFYQTRLNPGGVIYPKHLNLMCEVIESDYLYNFNVVNDENSFGFHIANYINQYSVNEHYDLHKNFQRKKLSKSQRVRNVLTGDKNPFVVRLEQDILPSSKVDGILYWFECIFSDEIKIDTSAFAHYNYACFLIDRLDTKQKNKIFLCVKQHDGLLKMYCETCLFSFICALAVSFFL